VEKLKPAVSFDFEEGVATFYAMKKIEACSLFIPAPKFIGDD